jgi:hypothetical protein
VLNPEDLSLYACPNFQAKNNHYLEKKKETKNNFDFAIRKLCASLLD